MQPTRHCKEGLRSMSVIFSDLCVKVNREEGDALASEWDCPLSVCEGEQRGGRCVSQSVGLSVVCV